jgi:serine/threonine-protein kinase HipA
LISSSAAGREPETAYVWIWLPGASRPVPAGRLDRRGSSLVFNYGNQYLERLDAISIYEPELPLESRELVPRGDTIHGCIADAGPDSWGQRVVLNELGVAEESSDIGPLTYLLSSDSDRIGALDFQGSPENYSPREARSASLEDLTSAAALVEEGTPLPPALADALLRGTSIGGARPKALLDGEDHRWIAKFSSNTDVYPVVQAEFLAMRFARLAGLEVANVEITEALGKKVLLVERFDRLADGSRRAMVSALTILELGQNGGRYGSYARLAGIIRNRFTRADATLKELFARITFNILTSNTDDHPRNHAAFWDGEELTLTPAYDISPGPRTVGEVEQVMAIGQDGWRYSQLAGCVERCGGYHLTRAEATELIDRQAGAIKENWSAVCDEAGLTQGERDSMFARQFLNPFAFEKSRSW